MHVWLCPRILRLLLIRDDTRGARLSAASDETGVHLTGSGFRGSGVRLLIDGPIVETACPLGVPHVHPAFPPPEELQVVLEAKTRDLSATLEVGVIGATMLGARPSVAPKEPLGLEWREIRVPLREMQPGGSAVLASGIRAIVLGVSPPTSIDLYLRNIRLLRVPWSPETSTPLP